MLGTQNGADAIRRATASQRINSISVPKATLMLYGSKTVFSMAVRAPYMAVADTAAAMAKMADALAIKVSRQRCESQEGSLTTERQNASRLPARERMASRLTKNSPATEMVVIMKAVLVHLATLRYAFSPVRRLSPSGSSEVVLRSIHTFMGSNQNWTVGGEQ